MCMELGEGRERERKLEFDKELKDFAKLKQRADICQKNHRTSAWEGPLRKQYRDRKTCAC